ncbi:MAG: hypothetical protein DRJ41_00330 [Thermoprotei archaeon]|nr:MAG: hypothetical protein DRJ41_00330 [Thermoprotei archaeon]
MIVMNRELVRDYLKYFLERKFGLSHGNTLEKALNVRMKRKVVRSPSYFLREQSLYSSPQVHKRTYMSHYILSFLVNKILRPTYFWRSNMKPVRWLIIVIVTTYFLGLGTGYFLSTSYRMSIPESIPEKVALLPDEDYYDIVKKLLERANKSIYVIMYVIKYDPKELDDPVNILLDTILRAKERGVKVKIITDDATYKSYKDTVSYMLSKGVELLLDESGGVRTHTKMVIVDEEYMVVGSHNWTESALSYNHEYSILIRSTELAKKAASYFERIWEKGRKLSSET